MLMKNIMKKKKKKSQNYKNYLKKKKNCLILLNLKSLNIIKICQKDYLKMKKGLNLLIYF